MLIPVLLAALAAQPLPLVSQEVRSFSIPYEECTGDYNANIVAISLPSFAPPSGMELWRIDFEDMSIEQFNGQFVENLGASGCSYAFEIDVLPQVYVLSYASESLLFSRTAHTSFPEMSGTLTAYDGTNDYAGTSGDGGKTYVGTDAVDDWSTSTPSVVSQFLGAHNGNVQFKCSRTLGNSFSASRGATVHDSSSFLGVTGHVRAWYRVGGK